MKTDYPRLNLMSRPGKLGLGSAIIEGFKWGREKGFRAVINMDADFSHDPVSLPAFIVKSSEADFVIGARYIPGGGTLNWGLHRRILSRTANAFARFMLRVPVHDLTTGYRLVRTDKLDALQLESISARGYGFLIAMTFRAVRAGLRVSETPIRFLDRQYGASKMSLNIIQEAFQLVLKLRSGNK
jgi:dolichol-phosphate mannosyltransferase